MATYKRTIHTTMNASDTVSAAEDIAAKLREQGMTADVGQVYDDVTVRWYGMPAVDITVTEADLPAEPAPETPPPAADTPEPMPVSEFGGTTATATAAPSAEELTADVAEPDDAAAVSEAAAATPATDDDVVGAIADTQPPEGEHFTESSTAATAPNEAVAIEPDADVELSKEGEAY